MSQAELDFGPPATSGGGPPARAAAEPSSPRTLHLIDASGYIFRAYHALPGLTTSKGVPTYAAYGFTRMLLKTLREMAPTHVALCFDKESRAGRLEIDPTYKANRQPPPEDLISQVEIIRRVAHALNVPIVEYAGWEADDVIATLAARAKAAGWKVRIIASDKDFVQLLDESVDLYDPVNDRVIGPKEAEEKFGVRPEQMRDYLALVGDSVDNVAKVPGIGPKTALELLSQFGDIDRLLARLSEVKKPKIREALSAHRATLEKARKLVSFRSDLPLDIALEDLARKPIREAEARALFSELEFFKLIQEMPAARPTPLAQSTEVVTEAGRLEEVARAAKEQGALAIVPAFDGPPFAATPVGLGLSLPDGETFYVPLAHEGGRNMGSNELRRVLGPVLEDASVAKVGHDLKALVHVAANLSCPVEGTLNDIELLSYLLNPSRREHALSDLARERLRTELPPRPNAGDRKALLADARVEDAAACFGASADAVRRLAPELWEEAERVSVAHIARELELPLIPILARMERAGVKVDLEALAQISAHVEALCKQHLEAVYALAGRSFNVGSPSQLAQVLFEELKLPVIKRGKTGPSTDQEVLEKLSEQHPLPKAIIEYRNVSKLKSTYLDTLPALIAQDGRVHTTFHQTAVATGRLSSSNPNLQNIPVRTELGRQIRRAFVAESGHCLVSADYSQIELRILAHIAGDAALVESFQRGEDVHTRTAAEVFSVAPAEVTSEQRRIAKMVNYAIAYGLSPHGLAQRLDIPTEEARSVIDRYFQRYSGIHRYVQETVAFAHKSGFVETLFGRRRYLPDLGSKNRSVAMAAERAAINMPIQGTAADLMKRAMIAIDEALAKAKLRTRMLLQVHDELLFECPESEVDRIVALAREAMSNAASLKVPLAVDVGVGQSWAEAH